MRVLALLLLAFLVAGCGGGGDDRLSVEEYREEFSQIDQQLEGIEQRFRTPADRASQVRVLRQTADELRQAADELAALRPPEAVAAEQDELVEAVRAQAESVEEVADAYAGGGDVEAVAPEAVQAVQRMVQALEALQAALAEAG